MTRLAIVLGVTHAVLAAIVFGSAIFNPLRASLLPIAMFYADFPVSILFEFASKHLADLGFSRLFVDAVVYTIFGSIWYFAIGAVLSKVFRQQ